MLGGIPTPYCTHRIAPPTQLRNLLVFNEARVRKWKTFSSLFAAICILLLGTLAVMRAHEHTAAEFMNGMAERILLEHRRVTDWIQDVVRACSYCRVCV